MQDLAHEVIPSTKTPENDTVVPKVFQEKNDILGLGVAQVDEQPGLQERRGNKE